MQFASGNVIKLGDVVLKEKQKDLCRKGGKLNTRFFDSTSTVMDIMDNGNCVLMSNKTNEILSTPCPMKHIKKYIQQDIDGEMDAVNNPVSSTVSIPTSSTVMTEIMSEDKSVQVASSVNNPVSSTVSIPTSSTVMTEIMNEDEGMQVASLVNNLVSSTHIYQEEVCIQARGYDLKMKLIMTWEQMCR